MYLGHFSKCGNMMDDIAFPADRKLPVVVIVKDEVSPRTCIVKILKTELVGFEIAEMETTSDLNVLTGRDVRLIAFNTVHTDITSVENRLALIAKLCPTAHVALLSNREDEATVSAAMQRGIRGFLPSSLAVEVAVAGLRLVLAGGVYRPLPIIKPNQTTSLVECTGTPERSAVHVHNGFPKLVPERMLADLTPREQHVLAALKLGLPNKLIAVRLNLSENTVKMHIQHIMRKCRAHNRTEAVLRCVHLPS
jgi:DNA-binding NarL/FixJ family response regulator